MQTKTTFLVSYDFGAGGLWAYIKAHSKDDIARRYPELTVLDDKPPVLLKTYLADIAAKMTFDIDDEPTGWLAELVRERRQA